MSNETSHQIIEEPKLQLRPHQKAHFSRIEEILLAFYFYVDGSETGTGKTYIAASVAKKYNLPCIVICPLAARKTWLDVLNKYKIGIYNLPKTGGIITYSTLRTRKNLQPKHGLLRRDDSDGVKFHPTVLLTKIIQAGVLVIFDECQRLKNLTAQAKAARSLIRHFYAVKSKSRIALLSGTMLDKEVQSINFLRMVGFINSRTLYTKIGGVSKMTGIQELHDWASKINSKAIEKFITENPFPFSRKGTPKYVFNLFDTVIRPNIMSTMPRGKTTAIKDVKNGFYYMEKSDELKYIKAIKELSSSLQYNKYSDTINRTKESMGAITNSLILIQDSKVRAMVRVAKETLEKQITDNDGNTLVPKVILFADYYDVIDYLTSELKDYNPAELTGRVSEKKRSDVIDAFQQHNSQNRLIIGNPLVGGLAVNLHDTSGLYPRYMFIMSGYRINELHQATGRVYRDGTKGTAYIRFFYGLAGESENSILTALSRKGMVLKRVHNDQSKNGVKFPNEYENEYEEVPDDKKIDIEDTTDLVENVNSNRNKDLEVDINNALDDTENLNPFPNVD